MEQQTSEILDLVKKKMREQGAFSRDAFKEYIQETIEYFREKGKLTDDDNEELIEDKIMQHWQEVESEFVQQ